MINKTRLFKELTSANLPVGGVGGPFAEQHGVAQGCIATWHATPAGHVRVDWVDVPSFEQQAQANEIVAVHDGSPEADAAAQLAAVKARAKAFAASEDVAVALAFQVFADLTLEFVGRLRAPIAELVAWANSQGQSIEMPPAPTREQLIAAYYARIDSAA